MWIGNLKKDELIAEVQKLGAERYRALQIWEWIYRRGADGFEDMANLPKELRDKLITGWKMFPLSVESVQVSRDGTRKYLFRSDKGDLYEGVLIPMGNQMGDRMTLCVSSQVGCALACDFCATGLMGFGRNLEVSEIVGQIVLAQKDSGLSVDNIVMMGMGEPFMNYENVLKAVEIMNDHDGLDIGARKITISTAGVADKIEKLGAFPYQVRLSVSLHATTDELRDKLMPINKRFNLGRLFSSIKSYVEKSGRKVTFEYILIRDVNDNLENVKGLIRMTKSLAHNINIIPMNPVPMLPYQAPAQDRVQWFVRELLKNNVRLTLRKQRGADIDAACGQLAIKGIIKKSVI